MTLAEEPLAASVGVSTRKGQPLTRLGPEVRAGAAPSGPAAGAQAYPPSPLTNRRRLRIKILRLGDRLTAGLQTLDLPIKVRILVPQPESRK